MHEDAAAFVDSVQGVMERPASDEHSWRPSPEAPCPGCPGRAGNQGSGGSSVRERYQDVPRRASPDANLPNAAKACSRGCPALRIPCRVPSAPSSRPPGRQAAHRAPHVPRLGQSPRHACCTLGIKHPTLQVRSGIHACEPLSAITETLPSPQARAWPQGRQLTWPPAARLEARPSARPAACDPVEPVACGVTTLAPSVPRRHRITA